jgi:hypothetical protein
MADSKFITVREITSKDYASWDKLIDESPQGTIFQSTDWLNICHRTLGRNFKRFGCFIEEKMLACCPLIFSDNIFPKTASSRFSVIPYGGIVTNVAVLKNFDQSLIEKMFNSLRLAIEKTNCSYIEIYNYHPSINGAVFLANGWKETIYRTYCLDPQNFEEKMSKHLRWSINKALKSGIYIDKLVSPEIAINLIHETLDRHKLTYAAPDIFYKEIFDFIQKKSKGKIMVTKFPSGEACSVEVIVHDKKRAYRWLAASSTILRKTGAPSLNLYEVLKELNIEGFSEIDLMGGPPNVNTFLKQFNPRIIEYSSFFRKGSLTTLAGKLKTKIGI